MVDRPVTPEELRLKDENERLRGTLRYIVSQAQQNYPGVLSVILCNAKAALNDDHQAMVAKAKEYLRGGRTALDDGTGPIPK